MKLTWPTIALGLSLSLSLFSHSLLCLFILSLKTDSHLLIRSSDPLSSFLPRTPRQTLRVLLPTLPLHATSPHPLFHSTFAPLLSSIYVLRLILNAFHTIYCHLRISFNLNKRFETLPRHTFLADVLQRVTEAWLLPLRTL